MICLEEELPTDINRSYESESIGKEKKRGLQGGQKTRKSLRD